jgi:hypothetical protein
MAAKSKSKPWRESKKKLRFETSRIFRKNKME